MKPSFVINICVAIICTLTAFSCRTPNTPPTPPDVIPTDTTPTFEPSGNIIIDIVNECDYMIGKKRSLAAKNMSDLGWNDVDGSFGYLTKIDETNGIEFCAMPYYSRNDPKDSVIYEMHVIFQAYGDSSILNYDYCKDLIREVGPIRHLYSGPECKFKAVQQFVDNDNFTTFACDIEECIDSFTTDDVFYTAAWFATDDEYNSDMRNAFPTIYGFSGLPLQNVEPYSMVWKHCAYSYFMLDFVHTDYDPYYTISIDIYNRDFE